LDRAVLETASDRYVIVEYLAEGGMGAIYLGKKLGVDGFEKEVVLKQLLPEYTREQKFIDLFLREARLSASLDHANIVRTVDLVNAGEDYFMVMEYVRGGDLRTLMRRARRRHRRFSAQSSVFIGHEILEALAYAHGKNGPEGRPLHLIHRDVSPSNILLSGAGEVKLTDFGIAKASTHRSVFHKVKGKVGYMSPEQARNEPIDKRADLFSLGVVLYEVLVGERLFVGDLLSSASMIYSQKVRAPSHRREDVPPELDAVILKSLSLDPRQRYQSAEEMQEALARAASRTRLLTNASEMAAHLKWVCGDDPSVWLKLEMLGPSPDESQKLSTRGQGTAVLHTGAEDADPFDDSEPHPARPQPVAALEHKELTSVIALRGDEVELLSDSEAISLAPARPRASQHPPTPTPTPTVPFAQERQRSVSPPTFENESSHAATRVRSSQSGNIEIDEAIPTPPARTRSVSGAQTIVRDGSPAARVESPRSGAREDARGSTRGDTFDQPADSEKPSWDQPTKAGSSRPQPVAPAHSSRRRLATSTATVKPERTDSVRKVAVRRRILPALLLLLLIGLAVGIAVAFSGPHVDDPDEPATQSPQLANPQTQTPR
jgi:serine/threonine protein kinase